VRPWATSIDVKKFDVTVVSPRNYFLVRSVYTTNSRNNTETGCYEHILMKAPTHNKRSGVWVWANGLNGPGYTWPNPISVHGLSSNEALSVCVRICARGVMVSGVWLRHPGTRQCLTRSAFAPSDDCPAARRDGGHRGGAQHRGANPCAAAGQGQPQGGACAMLVKLSKCLQRGGLNYARLS